MPLKEEGKGSRKALQPSRLEGVSLKTYPIRTRPEVTRAAPIQSTRLSSSVEGSSLSIAKIPNTKHAKVKPDNKYKGLFQVGLTTPPNKKNKSK